MQLRLESGLFLYYNTYYLVHILSKSESFIPFELHNVQRAYYIWSSSTYISYFCTHLLPLCSLFTRVCNFVDNFCLNKTQPTIYLTLDVRISDILIRKSEIKKKKKTNNSMWYSVQMLASVCIHMYLSTTLYIMEWQQLNLHEYNIHIYHME